MKLSKMHLKTFREVPNEAELPSHNPDLVTAKQIRVQKKMLKLTLFQEQLMNIKLKF